MRLVVIVFALLGPAVAAAAVDDPKLARFGHDDPKLDRGQALVARRNGKARPTVRLTLAYRRLTSAGLEADTIDWNAVGLTYYPLSGWVRLGLLAELGVGTAYDAWYVVGGLSLGAQYPWRVTPFVDARFAAGVLGGSFMGISAVSWTYVGGIEAGAEVFIASRFHFTAAVGWCRPVFNAVDAEQARLDPARAARRDFSYDSFTFRLGLGF
jgi:hypothetical protein